MNVKFDGRLRHQFWGEYSCTIGLQFADEASARDALAALGGVPLGGPTDGEKGDGSVAGPCGGRIRPNGPEGTGTWTWQQKGKVLVALMGSAALDALKSQFVAWGMDEKNLKAIDSVAHSIDYGDPFEGVIPIVPAEQERLFG